MKKLIFVCSPLRGDIDKNIENTKKYCRYVLEQGHIPYAPHLFFTQFLDECNEDERKMGIDAGIEMMGHCDELWNFIDNKDNLSQGMKLENEAAKNLNLQIKFIRTEL